MIFVKYMQDNGLDITLEAIVKPNFVISSYIGPFKESLEHEKFVTESINQIYAVAFEAKDYRTMQFLDWFIKEQGEEEATADANVRKMELFSSDQKSLYMLNEEFGSRVYTPASID